VSGLSDLTRERLRRFRQMRRAWYSLLILTGAFLVSLLGPLIAGDRPLALRYQGQWSFPIFAFHSDAEFGGVNPTEADYVVLRARAESGAADLEDSGTAATVHGTPGTAATSDLWMLLPPIPHDPLHTYLDGDEPPPVAPSRDHWLGTDGSGRDVLSRLIHGFRICMLFALSLTLIGSFSGIAIGGLQGYVGGRFDILGQRFTEIWSALPFLYVVILVGALLGRSFSLLLLLMSLFAWIGLSYYMRGEFLRLKGLGFVKAARALGMSHSHIFFREILPNALTPVITLLPFSLIGGISALTSLDFLGFGLQPPTPSWGELLGQGLKYLYAPWIALSTVGALFITLLLAAFIGEGVREAFDPKSERAA